MLLVIYVVIFNVRVTKIQERKSHLVFWTFCLQQNALNQLVDSLVGLCGQPVSGDNLR